MVKANVMVAIKLIVYSLYSEIIYMNLFDFSNKISSHQDNLKI